MIIANDNSFLIVTNTKCGTISLETYLCDIECIATRYSPKHGIEIPASYPKNKKIHFTLRSPIERFFSIWRYMDRKIYFGKWHWQDKEDWWTRPQGTFERFHEWTEVFLRKVDEKSHIYSDRIWCEPLSSRLDNIVHQRPANEIAIWETGWLGVLYKELVPNKVLGKRNTSYYDPKESFQLYDFLPEKTKNKLDKWAEKDCKRWGFKDFRETFDNHANK